MMNRLLWFAYQVKIEWCEYNHFNTNKRPKWEKLRLYRSERSSYNKRRKKLRDLFRTTLMNIRKSEISFNGNLDVKMSYCSVHTNQWHFTNMRMGFFAIIIRTRHLAKQTREKNSEFWLTFSSDDFDSASSLLLFCGVSVSSILLIYFLFAIIVSHTRVHQCFRILYFRYLLALLVLLALIYGKDPTCSIEWAHWVLCCVISTQNFHEL